MILTSTETVPGREILQVLGIARGNVVRARFVGRNIIESLRTIVGGGVNEYTQLMTMAREQAMQRLEGDASRLGADAVDCLRFTTSMILREASGILAYGTAVKLK